MAGGNPLVGLGILQGREGGGAVHCWWPAERHWLPSSPRVWCKLRDLGQRPLC